MKAFFLRALKDADVYIAILLGFTLALLGALGIVSFGIVAAGILASLTLLVLTTLPTRRKVEQLTSSLDNLDHHIEQISDILNSSRANARPSDVVRSLQDMGKLEDLIVGSQEIFMSGASLYTRTNMLRLTYKNMLKQGCSFKFIVLAPDSPLLPAHARANNRTAEGLRNEIQAALTLFAELRDFANTQNTIGKFEFVAFDYDPTVTLMRFDYESTGEVLIHVEIPSYHTDIWKRPVFHLTRADGDLFAQFDQICSTLWNDAVAQSTGQVRRVKK